jgi:3'(2'), 5'-bisphosphate nucleotidase
MVDQTPCDELAAVWSRLTEPICTSLLELRRDRSKLTVARKADGSVYTRADFEVQRLITQIIGEFDSDATIIAEEGAQRRAADLRGLVWVVDPIDGTREFLSCAGVEFCTSIAVLHDGAPIACLVVAPELAHGRKPLIVALDGRGQRATVNGIPVERPASLQHSSKLRVSATRPRSVKPRAFERILECDGVRVKTRATSLTLDMVRTCVDVSRLTGLASFDWFYRANQAVWDATAGIALALSSGNTAVGRNGTPLSPLSGDMLRRDLPTLDAAIIASRPDMQRLLRIIESE